MLHYNYYNSSAYGLNHILNDTIKKLVIVFSAKTKRIIFGQTFFCMIISQLLRQI